MRARVIAAIGIAGILAGMISTQAAVADDDTLAPLTFKSLQADLKKALVRQSIKDPLTPAGCLKGDAAKRTVCTFKIGNYVSAMASTEKGGSQIVAVTVICGADNAVGAAQCGLVYAAVLEMTTPLPQNVRGDILGTLIHGILVGNEVSISTDERKFIMQKGLGIWFHVYASGFQDAE